MGEGQWLGKEEDGEMAVGGDGVMKKREMREGDLQCNKTIWYWCSEEELNASVVLKEQEDLEGYFRKSHSPG